MGFTVLSWLASYQHATGVNVISYLYADHVKMWTKVDVKEAVEESQLTNFIS